MKDREGKKIPGFNSIQKKLILTVALTLGIILFVNLCIFNQISHMLTQVDSVFASNVEIVDLKEKLNLVQNRVYEYLNTKSSAALEDYYRYEQDFRMLLTEMNDVNMDSSMKILEKNIRRMSENYLETAAQTVQAKRGRNVERYKTLYEEETDLYQYISSYIYELNSQQFQQNSRNYQMLIASINVMKLFTVAVFVLAFLIGLIVISGIIRTMIKPLTKLSTAAHQVADGNFDVEIPMVYSQDEIGIVTSAFGQMVESIRRYVVHMRTSLEKEAQMKERELLMETRLKEAQLKYLRAQINPHFLFNSINAGAQLAMMEDAEQTGVFLEKMADFFRYDVKKMKEDTTLREEIQAVDNYIYILNVRFSGDIIYEKHILDDIDGMMDFRMPSMILQPLVENAVQHGIREMLGDGVISLIIEKEDGYIRIAVSDNGVGMTESQIRAVMNGESYSDSTDNDSNGIALDNVMHHLSLYYNRDDLFQISSEGEGMGTEVAILLPVEERES